MASLIQDLIKQYNEAYPFADPRTRSWLLLSDSPWPVWILSGLYIAMVLFGPKLMKDRKPFGLRNFMVVYNLGLVILSIYMSVEIVLAVWDADYNLLCANYNKDTLKNPKELRVAKVLWWYFFSKAIEYIDTLCMVLRKKFEQVTFLHVYHHVSMLNIWWWTLMFVPGGMPWFGMWINSTVHIVMYLYYGLSAIPSMRAKLWWKRYLTRMQLIQFMITLAHTLTSLYINCDFPHWGQYLLSGYMISLFVLFMHFYIKSYKRPISKSLQSDAEKKYSLEENGYSSMKKD